MKSKIIIYTSFLLTLSFAGSISAATTEPSLQDAVPKAGVVYELDSDAAEDLQPYKSPWFNDYGVSYNTWRLIDALADGPLHGLNPQSYNIVSLQDKINFYVSSVKADEYNGPESINDLKGQLDLELSNTFKTYTAHLAKGVLDPQEIQKNLKRRAPEFNPDNLYSALLSGEIEVDDAIAMATPQHKQYGRLMVAMRLLLKERESGVERTKVAGDKQLKPGSYSPHVGLLRQRLIETGDLSADTDNSNQFDEALIAAVKGFQARHGMDTDGRVGKKTRAALNITIDEDIEQLVMSLERWRWMPRDLGYMHILVNLPSFKLQMMNGNQKVIDMPVIVGAQEHQTPVFSKDVKFIEVAPTWTVPHKITQNELLPIERRRPGYLKKKGFDFFSYRNGRLEKVAHSKVTSEEIMENPFPYIVRQQAGKTNALGKLKILMPNPDAIYLHDTQAKKLFKNTERAYSHGCIRLSDPDRLAGLIFQIDGKNPQQTKQLLASKKTKRVRIKSKIETHLAYFTTWIDEDGKIQKRKDIYWHNARLKRALFEKKTLLAALDKHFFPLVASLEDQDI